MGPPLVMLLMGTMLQVNTTRNEGVHRRGEQLQLLTQFSSCRWKIPQR